MNILEKICKKMQTIILMSVINRVLSLLNLILAHYAKDSKYLWTEVQTLTLGYLFIYYIQIKYYKRSYRKLSLIIIKVFG